MTSRWPPRFYAAGKILCQTPPVFSASSASKNISRGACWRPASLSLAPTTLQLLNACLPVEPLWSAYAKVMDAMTDYAVDFRYPGHTATLRTAKLALKHCRSLRAEAQQALGLKK